MNVSNVNVKNVKSNDIVKVLNKDGVQVNSVPVVRVNKKTLTVLLDGKTTYFNLETGKQSKGSLRMKLNDIVRFD